MTTNIGINEERYKTIVSWSVSSDYEDARKEWTLLKRASEDSNCELCNKDLEYPVYIKNMISGAIT
ncbi:hypothetical protein Psfp_02626 [Pelotomaculum sp. FP]|uniref:hypothetical protein n=1 Tax=Pelotomaculum sp. FP TaxID=261474 RepID=UPI001065EF9D|nr:hypothetical protein [Pelotomaculum sp. FP]TEB14766.1 hypothetical protein Psfp_02626 [Pelotomaculum sp. FP]